MDARIRKRHSDLTASRGELIEVNIESAFEPIIQGYIIFPNIIDIFDKVKVAPMKIINHILSFFSLPLSLSSIVYSLYQSLTRSATWSPSTTTARWRFS